MKKTVFILILLLSFSVASGALALQRGAILYHTSKNDTIYGRDAALELPCSTIQLAHREMKSGHVGLYIGNQQIIHAVFPTVEETSSENFIPQSDLDEGCRYLGAKVPIGFDAWPAEQVDQLILLAREQLGAHYDIQFRHQKGPYDDGFTCVGLVEYLYEQVGYNITPEGYYAGGAGGRTYTQTYDCEATFWLDWEGDNTFAELVEFSSFEHPLADTLNVGMIHEGRRYMFFPYTQYLQATTVSVTTDVPVSGGSGSNEAGAPGSGDSGGCFIATAAYGSSLHPHLHLLREVRDRYLRKSSAGQLFLAVYGRYAPSLAAFINRHEALKALTRVALLPILGLCFLILCAGPMTALALFAALLVLPCCLARRSR